MLVDCENVYATEEFLRILLRDVTPDKVKLCGLPISTQIWLSGVVIIAGLYRLRHNVKFFSNASKSTSASRLDMKHSVSHSVDSHFWF